MKKIILILVLTAQSVYAQNSDFSLIKNATLNILVNSVATANRDLNRIINSYSLKIGMTDINNSKKVNEYELYSNKAVFENVISDIEKLGNIELKKVESFNYETSESSSNYDLEYLLEQKKIIGKEISEADRKSDIYKELFNRERELDKQIYDKNKEIISLNEKIRYSVIRLKFYEKTVQDLDAKDDFIVFINMPGVETKYFHLENSDTPEMENNYFGGSLRYMFTKGRSYILIGIMKPLVEKSSGDEIVNDIVTYSFGKDFYPRYFGQGKNTFFNPFSGFEIGGIVLTSDTAIEHMFMIEPHIGLEIFKNQFVIVDTRIGYNFPLDEKKIKSHRGFTHNISVNIVF